MRKDLVDAVLGMYAAIEHAANAQVAIGHTDQGRRKGVLLRASIWILSLRLSKRTW